MAGGAVVAVVGLGAAGAATACALARRGVRVLALDARAPPHEVGSSHGETRMIREAYFEAPFYVPLVQRAFDAWRRLEERSGRRLLRSTGGLMIGTPEGALVKGSRASARAHGLPHEELDAAEIRRRFPALRPSDDLVGVLEPRAGYLRPEACLRTQLELARADGAEIRFDEPVERWTVGRAGVRLRTPSEPHIVPRAVFCVGAWTSALFPELRLPLTVERAVQFWFEPVEAGPLRPDLCPVYVWEPEPDGIWYGFPLQPRGVKVGFHHGGEMSPDPAGIRREVAPAEVEAMRSTLRRWIPDAAGRPRGASVCLYTNTPDRHFLVDRHPDVPEVLIATACSGHGFKFASALGEALAALALDEDPGLDLAPFRLDRFAGEERRGP